MPIWTCAECGARTTQGGDCTQCGRSLGSPRKAVLAALGSMVLLSTLWISASYLLGLQLGVVALLYGGLISGAVAHFSGGRGVRYQLLASTVTLVGMLGSECVLVILLWDRLCEAWRVDLPTPTLFAIMEHLVQYDAATILFCIFGLLGGFWLWKQPEGA